MRKFQKFLKRRQEACPSSRSDTWLERNKTALELIAIWTESIGVLVAAVFAIQQYADNSAAEQVNKTLSYVDRYHADDVGNARETLEKVFDEKKEEIFKVTSGPDAETQFLPYVLRIVQEKELDIPLNKVFEFYDELNICAEAKLCDEKTAIRYFGKYAWDFTGLMKPYILHLREAYHDPMMGHGVMHFAHAFRTFQQDKSPSGKDGSTETTKGR